MKNFKIFLLLIVSLFAMSFTSLRFASNTQSNFLLFGNLGSTQSSTVSDTSVFLPIFYNNSYYIALKNTSGFYKLFKWDGSTLTQPLGVNGTCNSTGCDDLTLPSDQNKNKKNMVVFNGSLYFVAKNSSGYFKLFKWDGTTASQVFSPGTCGATTCNDFNGSHTLFLYQGNLYFSALNSSAVTKLFMWDGVSGSPTQPLGVNGTCGATTCNDNLFSNSYPIVYQNNLYFSGVNSSSVAKLFKWDGSTLTHPLGANGTCGLNTCADTPVQLAIYNNNLYFQANIATSGSYHKLHMWDGTTLTKPLNNTGISGSATITDLPTISALKNEPMVFNSKLYFVAKNQTSGGYNRIYSWDGTTLNGPLGGTTGLCGTTTCQDVNLSSTIQVTENSIYFANVNSGAKYKIYRINSNDTFTPYLGSNGINGSGVHDTVGQLNLMFGKLCFIGYLPDAVTNKIICITRF